MDAWLPLHFLRPGWLLLLPVLLLAYWRLQRRGSLASWRRLIAPELLPYLLVPGAGRLRGHGRLLVLLALLLLALAGPAWFKQPLPFAERRAPLLVALDLSSAMNASDLAPSRLERAKLKLHDLLQRREGGRTALIVYAGSAHVLLPLTEDRVLFALYLDSLQTSLMPRSGKNTEAVLDTLDRLQASLQRPAMRLLVTDALEPHLAQRLVRQPTVIWAAGGDAERLAEQLEVPVVAMTTDDSDVPRIDRELDAHYRAALADQPDAQWQDQGWWLVWPAALLLLLRFRRGILAALLLLPLLGLPPPAMAAELALWQLWRTPAQQALHLYRTGDFDGAAELFEDPLWRGAALYRAGDFAAALAAFESLGSADGFYNQGNALAMLGRYAESAERYQRALALAPEWQQAQDNLGLVLRLLEQLAADNEGGEVTEEPDEVRLDLTRKGGEAVEQQGEQEQAQRWLESLDAGPSGFLRHKMALQLEQQRRELMP